MELDLADLQRELSRSPTPEPDASQGPADDPEPLLRDTEVQIETRGFRRLIRRIVWRR